MSRASGVGVLLEVEPRAQPFRSEARTDRPFRIAILADLGGRDGSAFRPRPVRIDRDDFDNVLARIRPSVTTAAPVAMRIEIGDLDDFHPDRLYERLPVFRDLRSLRARLDDPRTFESAARELSGEIEPAAPQRPPVETGGSLLDRMVDDVEGPAPAGTRRPAPPPDDFRAHIRSLVAPYIVPGEDPRKADLIDRVDLTTGDLLRGVLHDPSFQALESTWRSVRLLVQRIDTGADLQIHVIDATRADLAADAAGGRALRRVLVDEVESSPWTIIVTDQAFGPAPADLALLQHLASLASDAGAPLLAAAAPGLAGCTDFETNPDPSDRAGEDTEWHAFRRTPEARWIGVTAPRLLVRLPYGRTTEECEAFEFEEMDSPPAHGDYLWGSGAFGCALLLAESFTRSGWSMRPGESRDIEGLPLHVYRDHHEALAKPCAECWMTDRTAGILLDRGLIPLASMKDRDVVRVVRFQSAADPASPLPGRWAS